MITRGDSHIRAFFLKGALELPGQSIAWRVDRETHLGERQVL